MPGSTHSSRFSVRLGLALALVSSMAGCTSAPPPVKTEPEIRPWSFIDTQGKQVISLVGDLANPEPFSEGLAQVRLQGKSGFVDHKGNFVIPAQYEAAGKFQEGVAAVLQGSKWGFIDKQGKLVIEPQFDDVGVFTEGLCSFCKDELWGFIDHQGKVVVPPQSSSPSHFSDGLALAFIKGKWGYIDKTGAYVIEPQYRLAYNFHDGIGACEFGQNHWKFVDKKNATVVDLGDMLHTPDEKFAEGLLGINRKTGKAGELRFGYIDRSGKYVIPPKFTSGGAFSEGLAVFAEPSSTKYGYINVKGVCVIKPQFDHATSFHENRAMVQLDNKRGYIDKSGKIVIAPQFAVAQSFSEGLAGVKSISPTGHSSSLIYSEEK